MNEALSVEQLHQGGPTWFQVCPSVVFLPNDAQVFAHYSSTGVDPAAG